VPQVGGPEVFQQYNPNWGHVGGLSFNLPSPSFFSGSFFTSTRESRQRVLWPSGAVAATASGSGELDVASESVPTFSSGPSPAREITIVDESPEFLPGWPWPTIEEGRKPTVWEDVEVVFTDEEPPMAHDWGHTARQIATGLFGGNGGSGSVYEPTGFVPALTPTGGITGPAATLQTMSPTNANCGTGCNAPRYLTYDCRTQTFSPKRRRRRPRLLTATDQRDLGVIVAMFGKGAASQIALAAAVKR